MRIYVTICISMIMVVCTAQNDSKLFEKIDKIAMDYQDNVIELRRYFHQNPELSNREFETAKYIVKKLKDYDLKIETDIAKTGVVAVLDTGKEGPTVGLRADIDALPVTERVDLPFKSTVKTEYLGEDVGVMHACGHDTHVAMLFGAIEVIHQLKDELVGKFVFIFQPAEEGAPPGEEGGAKLMVKEGVIDRYGIDVMFGQHISSGLDVGTINYKVGGMMAAADRFEIKVKGKQSHGSRPWSGIDPIVISAQIILGLQTIISRQTELTKEPAVISVGKIQSGVRNNIIPEEAIMIGTIRTFNTEMQDEIHERIKTTAKLIAESGGATAEVEIIKNCPVTFNDPKLTAMMIPSLFDAIGEDNVRVMAAITGAEDYSYFAEIIPAMYWFVGGKSKSLDKSKASSHHTPDFYIDETGMLTGVKALSQMAISYGFKVTQP